MAYSGSYRPGRGKSVSPNVPKPSHRTPPPREAPDSLSRRLRPLMKKLEAVELDNDDLLMLLIFYLMYRESGDWEMLLLMGAMLFA